jgi:hypothetical protein
MSVKSGAIRIAKRHRVAVANLRDRLPRHFDVIRRSEADVKVLPGIENDRLYGGGVNAVRGGKPIATPRL